MTVKELKQELKSRGLKTSGLKAELKIRLSEALASSEPTIAETTDALTTEDTTIADFEEYINVRTKNNPFILPPVFIYIQSQFILALKLINLQKTK